MSLLKSEHLNGKLIGLERETLRINSRNNRLADTPHPKSLGSALTHPSITTDFGEQMLEFVTKPHESLHGAYNDLHCTTALVQQHLANQDEYLWPYSMPPILPKPEHIQHADFGPSGAGQFKELYRIGLTHRYGTEMQLISGMHFNYSLPEANIVDLAKAHGYNTESAKDARNQVYLGAIRNVNRYSWLSCYLLGASPAVDQSFVHAVQRANELPLSELHDYDDATSLRLSDIGYTNKRRCRWQAEINNFDKFINSLAVGLAETCSIFGGIGIKDDDGEWKQLNDKVLQIENEYYSIARPKAIQKKSEPPLVALARDGVTYLEFRMTDLDPFATIGVDPCSLVFLEVFILYCLTTQSPKLNAKEQEVCDENRNRASSNGQGDITITKAGEEVKAADEAVALLSAMMPIAKLVDENNAGNTDRPTDWPTAQQAITKLIERVRTDQRISQRITADKANDFAGDINQFAAELGKAHQRHLIDENLSDDYRNNQDEIAKNSLLKAEKIAAESEGLESYMADYQAELDTLFSERKIPILN